MCVTSDGPVDVLSVEDETTFEAAVSSLDDDIGDWSTTENKDCS